MPCDTCRTGKQAGIVSLPLVAGAVFVDGHIACMGGAWQALRTNDTNHTRMRWSDALMSQWNLFQSGLPNGTHFVALEGRVYRVRRQGNEMAIDLCVPVGQAQGISGRSKAMGCGCSTCISKIASNVQAAGFGAGLGALAPAVEAELAKMAADPRFGQAWADQYRSGLAETYTPPDPSAAAQFSSAAKDLGGVYTPSQQDVYLPQASFTPSPTYPALSSALNDLARMAMGASGTAAADTKTNYVPWILGGAAALGAIAFVVLAKKKADERGGRGMLVSAR